jgi:hypothetical protein
MKNEMDLMRMDERQKLSWLRANRATLMLVGVVWLALIVWEYAQGRTAAFLIVMVPVFASARLAFYWLYARDREARWPYRVLFFATVAVGHLLATIAGAVGELSTGGLLGLFREPGYTAWRAVLRVLEFPILTVVRVSDPHRMSAYGWWAMVLNSLLWAAVIFFFVRFLGRRPSETRPELGIAG